MPNLSSWVAICFCHKVCGVRACMFGYISLHIVVRINIGVENATYQQNNTIPWKTTLISLFMIGAPMFVFVCVNARRPGRSFIFAHIFALRQLFSFFLSAAVVVSSISNIFLLPLDKMVFFPSDTVLPMPLLLLLCSVLIPGVIFIMGIQMGHPFRLRRADQVMRMLFLVGFSSRGCMCLCVQFFNKGVIYLSGRYPVDLCF